MEKLQDVFYLAPEKAVTDDDEKYVLSDVSPAKAGETSPRQHQETHFHGSNLSLGTQRASSTELGKHLDQLAGLIANVTEAYTVAIFLADESEKTLRVGGLHTLSRDFIQDSRIAYGAGLVGWTAENGVRISVCPFERDATTLLYYGRDQDLKSFIAVPILDRHDKLLGVISCDSKKSYAFAKITEKILLDCAGQAATILGLVKEVGSARKPTGRPREDILTKTLENLWDIDDEPGLLKFSANLPRELVKRDALVVMTTAEGGVGEGNFYSSSTESRIEHRLLELVCKHKKVICGRRSVHALPVDDIKQRSFLSVPFHALGREAGSLNLLSKPYDAFSAGEIGALERIAKVVGQCLERIRLRDSLASSSETTGLLSWKHFILQGKLQLADAKTRRTPMSLIRLSLKNTMEIEKFAGPEIAASLMARMMRLVDQVARPPSISCYLYGFQILILSETSEADKIVMRFRRLVERISSTDFIKDTGQPSVKLGTLISQGLEVTSASCPRNGSTINELAAKTRCLMEVSLSKPPIGEVANAGNW